MVRELERTWTARYGPVRSRGSVSFLGSPPMELLRFGPDTEGLVRYATVGMCRTPMGSGAVVDPATAPRAELVLALRARADTVLRALAAVASAPAVDGLVLTPDATVDLQQPLWDDAPFTAVLVQPELGTAEVGPGGPFVQLTPVVPITATELAYRRVHGAAALREAWVQAGTDLAGLRRG